MRIATEQHVHGCSLDCGAGKGQHFDGCDPIRSDERVDEGNLPYSCCAPKSFGVVQTWGFTVFASDDPDM